MKRVSLLCALLATSLSLSCDGDDISDNEGATLDDFLPVLPEPTGESQSVFAGEIATGNAEELIPGPASSGVIGDFFMRNSKARFVVQAPAPLVGVVPSGGNLIDVAPLGADGGDLSPDHYGETSVIYQMGRHCSHSSMEVVRDGSDGGAAVLRARGFTGYNEFVNIRGIGLLPIQNELVPELPDFAECATTYVLEPDSATVNSYFTIFNPTEKTISGPMGMLSDTGGEVFVFLPGTGYSRLGSVADALDSVGNSTPYMVWQGPEVAYGILPRHEDPTTQNGSVVLLGVSLFIFRVNEFFEVLDSAKNQFFSIAQNQGFTFQVDVFAGRDAAAVEEEFQRITGGSSTALSGTVSWSDGSATEGARIGIFDDANGNGSIDPDEPIVSYVDGEPDGSFAASIPAGDYLLRAEVVNAARSEAVAISTGSGPATADLSLQLPVVYDYRVVDDGDNDALIPARITVIGAHPVAPDLRTHGEFDTFEGIVTRVISKRGTSTDVGDGADDKIVLPPGGEYRILVSRGTEWSIAETVVAPTAGETPDELVFRLRRVVDTSQYIASEYHVHSIGSPDSPIPNERRVATAVADGVEFYATTDHDFVTQQQPIIEMLGLDRLVRSISGIEISPLVYGHFNAWPMNHDASSPNGGAVEWPFGDDDYAMVPEQIFAAAREKGAELIQVNHPRSGPESNSDITEHFDRMGLYFDYEARSFQGDPNTMPVPTDWLRLPPENANLFNDGFNSLEVWNGFRPLDLNEDGVREITALDTVMRDWFNFLSFGKALTPIGSSDTHYEVLESMGMPRTLVRVTDDSAAAIESGTGLTREILDNLSRASGAVTDVVVTDGPHIRVRVGTDEQPLGKVHDGSSGSIEIQIDAQSADWAHIDTIELFANNTPDIGAAVTTLQPFACFTSRTDLAANDPCALAELGGAGTLNVNTVNLGGGFSRFEASKTLSVSPGDIASREGATGEDAWIVVRVRGDRPIYPLFVGNLVNAGNVDTFVNGTPNELESALEGKGRPATAFTSAFFVDFDGGGFTAQFAP